MPLRAPAPDPSTVIAGGLAAQPFDLSPFDRRLDAGSRAPLAVAFSGGGDSLALLIAAKAWADRVGRRVVALHVDHALQPSSREWAARAEAAARGLGADFRLLVWTGDKPASGIPARARAARLALLADAARETGARVILLGHTADDVREGEAMRAEGSTLGHLRDWSPSPVWPAGRGLFHFRPLLGVGRAELRERLAASGLGWIDDPANEDLRYARARARRSLQTSANEAAPAPALPEGLATLAGQASFDVAGGIAIDRAALAAADPAGARAFVRMALLCAAGTSRPPRGDSLERLVGRLVSAERLTATLSGARVHADAGEVLFARDAGEIRRGNLQPQALAPGEIQVWDGRFEVAATDPGVVVRPLAGLSAHLPRTERARLRQVPALLRPALPVAVKDQATMTCPILADGQVSVRPLARLRLLSAAGLAATESQADALAHGVEGSHVLFWGEQLKKASE